MTEPASTLDRIFGPGRMKARRQPEPHPARRPRPSGDFLRAELFWSVIPHAT